MNDAPGARQSREGARPQAGESTFPHHLRTFNMFGDFLISTVFRHFSPVIVLFLDRIFADDHPDYPFNIKDGNVIGVINALGEGLKIEEYEFK